VLTDHAGYVRAMAVTEDGQAAVSGGDDGTVRVWDLAGTAAPRVLTGHHGPVTAVAVSDDGRTAVSGGDDGTVRVWDLADGRESARWIADADVVTVAFNTAIIVAGDTAGQVHALQLNVPIAPPA
jgi:WD40 repeat protein